MANGNVLLVHHSWFEKCWLMEVMQTTQSVARFWFEIFPLHSMNPFGKFFGLLQRKAMEAWAQDYEPFLLLQPTEIAWIKLIKLQEVLTKKN